MTHPSQTTASTTTASFCGVVWAPPSEMPETSTRTAVAMTSAVTAATIRTGSRFIAARKPKNAQPAAMNSVSATPLVQVCRSPVSMVAATAIPQAQSRTIESARNARVRSR